MRSRLPTILYVLIGTGAAATTIGTLLAPPLRRLPLSLLADCPGVIGADKYCYGSNWPQAAVLILAWLVFWAWAWWMVTLLFRSRSSA
jgi:hypothetical protein